MPRLAANLSMLYAEHAFLDRFAAAARDGFRGVEYLFPYDHPVEQIAQRLAEHGLTQVLFNAPPGDWAAGERGLACLPGREAQFQEGLQQALHYAQALRCERLHVMAGVVPPGLAHADARACYLRNLRWAAGQAGRQGVRLMIEPINGRDMPGYFLQRQQDAHAVLQELGASNVQVQFDLYHWTGGAFPDRRRTRAARARPGRAAGRLPAGRDRRGGGHLRLRRLGGL